MNCEQNIYFQHFWSFNAAILLLLELVFLIKTTLNSFDYSETEVWGVRSHCKWPLHATHFELSERSWESIFLERVEMEMEIKEKKFESAVLRM